ncbi:MAG: hypothetical protein IJO73_02370 [Clostridia bacterium]|nr:hypothetical protein [Clostridia bacterium]
MFDIEQQDNTLHVHKGDRVFFGVTGKDKTTGEPLVFQPGDIVRIKVYGKNNVENVVLQKDFAVESYTEEVYIYLDSDDTSFGGNINKMKEYSYEVSVNPDTPDEDTIIGHFIDGPVSWFHYPEGAEIPKTEIKPEAAAKVDDVLDMLSSNPISNRAVAAAVTALRSEINSLKKTVGEISTSEEGE